MFLKCEGVWYAGWNFIPPCIPNSHQHGITSTKCRKNTVFPPDDGPTVARNMWRLINILRINCVPSWFYLQKKKNYTQCEISLEVTNIRIT